MPHTRIDILKLPRLVLVLVLLVPACGCAANGFRFNDPSSRGSFGNGGNAYAAANDGYDDEDYDDDEYDYEDEDYYDDVDETNVSPNEGRSAVAEDFAARLKRNLFAARDGNRPPEPEPEPAAKQSPPPAPAPNAKTAPADKRPAPNASATEAKREEGKKEEPAEKEKNNDKDTDKDEKAGTASGDDKKKPALREAGLLDEMICGMMAVNPDEFSTDTDSLPMTLKQVAGSVLRGNRTIRVAGYRPEQARADIMSAKSVYDTELFADWTHSRTDTTAAMIITGYPSRNREFRNEVGRTGIRQHTPSGAKVSAYREWNSGIERDPGSDKSRGHGGAFVAEISQPVLNGFADMENRSVIQINRLQVDITQEEFRQTVMETMTQALEAYWSVVQAREDVRINKEVLDMAEKLLEREIGRKDEGISTQLDVDRAREAVSTRAYSVHLAKEQYMQAQETLKYYMNDKAVPVGMDIHVDPVESLDTPLVKVDIEKAIDTALTNRPEMLNADLAIRTSEVRHRYAKHTLLPELNLIGSVRRNDLNGTTPTTGSSTLYTGTDWSVGMEFSMPLGNMKARSNLRKAEAEMSQVIEDKKNKQDLIVTEVRTIAKAMEQVVREIPLNKRAMESAQKVLEGEWARLELDQVGNRDLLQAQDLVAVTERNYVGSLARYNIYIVRLFAVQGVLLDKMGIYTAD